MAFKRIKKSTKTTLLIVSISMTIVMILGFVTSGFQNWDKNSISGKFEKHLNENNLYTAECMTLKDSNDGYGVVITTYEDGSFKVSGSVKGEDDKTYVIGTVELEPGTYTFTSCDDASRDTVYVVADIGGGNLVAADFTGNTFAIAEKTTVTLRVIVKPEVKVNSIIYPVIVSGEEPGDFYQ